MLLQLLDHGDEKRGRLTGPRPRHGDDIFSSEDLRDRFPLDRSRHLVSHLHDCLEEKRTQIHALKAALLLLFLKLLIVGRHGWRESLSLKSSGNQNSTERGDRRRGSFAALSND